MTKRIEIDPADFTNNDWVSGWNDGGSGNDARHPDVEDYMRGWKQGCECYEEFMRENSTGPLSIAVIVGVICAAAYLSILIFKHITS